jgi:hypothetical protein
MWDKKSNELRIFVETYQRIVSIVDETLTLMDEIDATAFLEQLADVGLGEDGRLV